MNEAKQMTAAPGGPEALFDETQRFTQRWLWILVGISSLGGLVALVTNLPHLSPWIMALLLWMGVGLPALLASVTLRTVIRKDGIYVRLFPFHWSFQRFGLEELKSCEVRTYRPIREYGGWGLRWGFSGKAYSTRGNQGLQLETKKGARVLIGTQRPDELGRVIGSAWPDLAPQPSTPALPPT